MASPCFGELHVGGSVGVLVLLFMGFIQMFVVSEKRVKILLIFVAVFFSDVILLEKISWGSVMRVVSVCITLQSLSMCCWVSSVVLHSLHVMLLKAFL